MNAFYVRHHEMRSREPRNWLQALVCSVLAVGVALPVLVHAQTRLEETALTALNFPDTAVVTYTGKWHQTEALFNWSGGTAAATNWGLANPDQGFQAARATLSFSGTGVTWIGGRAPVTGIANVYIDGVLQETVDTFSTDFEIQVPIFTRSGLAPGTHQLMIEVTGTKTTNPASTCNPATTSCAIIVVDAFDIEGTPSGRLQETGPTAVTYFGAWYQGIPDDATRKWSGGSSAWSKGEVLTGLSPVDPQPGMTAGLTTRAVLTFSGTKVVWIGAQAPGTGIANVYIDGKFVTVVDTVSPDANEHLQVPVFTSNVLARGIHTLAIEVTGTPTNRPLIVVDAFDVTP